MIVSSIRETNFPKNEVDCPMITLKTREVVADRQDVERLRGEFQERNCVLLTGLLDASLLALLQPLIDNGLWCDKTHGDIAKEVVLHDERALSLLHFAINSPVFLDAARTMTGCDEITWFGGRIYSLIPGTDHYDSWHDDVVDFEIRLVGMSINLSPKGYDGGVFELRERAAERVPVQIANSGVGNARLFRIAPELQHQVTVVTGSRPRIAFAGWFYAGEPDLLSRLRKATTPSHLD